MHNHNKYSLNILSHSNLRRIVHNYSKLFIRDDYFVCCEKIMHSLRWNNYSAIVHSAKTTIYAFLVINLLNQTVP